MHSLPLPLALCVLVVAALAGPCQLIDIDETKEKLIYNKKCFRGVKSLHEDVYVVTVMGDFQSGKSFMINMLTGLTGEEAMTVGNSLKSETRGIWIPNELVAFDENGELRSTKECKALEKRCKYILFNDMEGYGSIDRSLGVDEKLFTFGLRSADLVIFNMREHPKRDDISFLQDCWKRADKSCYLKGEPRIIEISAEENGEEVEEEQFIYEEKNCDDYPSAIVTLQKSTNFLELEELINELGIDEYLERFEKHDYIQLPFPVKDVDKFKQLKFMEFNDMSQEYKDNIKELRKKIYNMLDSEKGIKWVLFPEVYEYIVDSINVGSIERIFKKALNGAHNAKQLIIAEIPRLAEGLKDFCTEKLKEIKPKIDEVTEWFKRTAQPLVEKVKGLLKKIPKGLIESLKKYKILIIIILSSILVRFLNKIHPVLIYGFKIIFYIIRLVFGK